MLCSDAPVSCLLRSGERFNPECISITVKHGGGGIMVWGAFSSADVGELIRCEQSTTAKEYQKNIREWEVILSTKVITWREKQRSHFSTR